MENNKVINLRSMSKHFAIGAASTAVLLTSVAPMGANLPIGSTPNEPNKAEAATQKFYTNEEQQLVVFHIENPQRPIQPGMDYAVGVNGDGKIYGNEDREHMRYDATEPIRMDNANGKIVWCIESGVLVDNDATYTNSDKMNTKQFQDIGVVAYHGYHKEHGQKNPKTNKEFRDFIYTQRYIQELGQPNSIGKERVVGISGLSNTDGESGPSTDFDAKGKGITVSGYNQFKDRMDKEIKLFHTKPSFDIQTDRPNDTIRDGDTVRFEDKSGALGTGKFKIESTPDNVTAKIEGNHLVVTAAKGAKSGNINIVYDVPNGFKEVPVMYTHGNSQNISSGSIGKATPVPIQIGATPSFDDVSPENGKHDQHGNPVQGAVFEVRNLEDGTTYETTSNAQGQIELSGKQGDRLEITEVKSPDGYLLDRDNNRYVITLTDDGISQFDVINYKSEYIGTKASNDENGGQKFSPEPQVKLTDTVEYANLDVNETYQATGYLMDKETGEPIVDENGEPIQSTREFKPKTKDGTFTMEFVFDAESMRGKTLVVFEELSLRGTTVADHKDLEDSEQTVTFTNPEIGTTATSGEDGGKHLEARSSVVVQDLVEYSDLMEGDTYRLNGTLMDKATGEPLQVNGETVTATKEFTPEEINGTETLDFELNASELRGKDVVVYEELERQHGKTKEWNIVAEHKDINDAGQTVHFTDPSIQTTATSTEDGLKYLDAVEDVGITDTVEYENLLPGKTYQLTGEVMDKETGEPLEVDGEVVTDTVEFTTDGEEGGEPVNGSVELPFYFNANDLQGKDLVVFEELARDDEPVAEHKDIEDEGQTVTVTNPEIGTIALNKGAYDEKKSDPFEEVTLHDVVSYKDLLPGKTYQVKGQLMDKETGEVLEIEGQTVDGESTFTTPEGTDLVDGEVEVEFNLDASSLRGKDTVVFEDLFRDKPTVQEQSEETSWVHIAEHKDIEDENQTIHINDPQIEIDKEVSQENFQRGDTLTYKFTVTNPGDVLMQNIKFTDEMFKNYKLDFDSLEPGESKTFEIDYVASKKDVQNNYIYNEASIEGETPDEYEEDDKDNVVTVSDKEIGVVQTPEDCGCEFPNIVVDIDNNNQMTGVITNDGEFINEQDLTNEQREDAEKGLEEGLKEEEKEKQEDKDNNDKSDENVEPNDNDSEPNDNDSEPTDEENQPELAETGLANPTNQIALVIGGLLIVGGIAGLVYNRKRKDNTNK